MKTKPFALPSSIAVILTIVFGIAFNVSATCTPSSLSLSPVSLNAITGTVDTIDTTTAITDNCGNTLEYTATVTGGSSWLSMPSSGKDSLKVTANNINGIAPGIYTGTATIKSTGLTESSLTVTLTIGSSCSATLDNTLKMNLPIIKYTDSASVKYYFWLDEVYASDPSRVLFKLSDYGSQSTTGYNCNMSWLDSDLMIYTRDLLYGGSFYWLKLAYDTSLSDSSNYYFYAKNYGEGSMSGADSSLYFGFSYGTTNTTNAAAGLTGSKGYIANTGNISFEVLLTNGAASETVGVMGYLNSDYSLSNITRGIFAKTKSDGQKVFHKIDFGSDGLPASLSDHSTGYTIYFSGYSNGVVHIMVIDSDGQVVVSDKMVDIEGEWFSHFANQIATASVQKGPAATALPPVTRAENAEKTLKAIGYAMGVIFDKIACAVAPATTAGKHACGGRVAANTFFGCDLAKTRDGICNYINVVQEGLTGGPTLASCVANLTTQPASGNTGSSVVDCIKDVAATVLKKAAVTFVKEITPGSASIGTAVTITGAGFGTTKGTVTFNGTIANITSWADTEIKTTVPAGASTGYVVVTDATGVASNGVMVTVTQNTYIVTPTAGTGGSISPSTPQTVTQGATTTFTLTPDAGYTASVSGTCGGALSGSTYTTNAITASCTVIASFTANTNTTSTCICVDPGVTLTVVSGCTGWTDATQCSGWFSVVAANGGNGPFTSGTSFTAYGCTIRINCP